MTSVLKFSAIVFLLCLSACSVFRGPPGPKIYDNATVVVVSDKLISRPPITESELLKNIRLRYADFTEAALQSEGDLKVVSKCGPRTLKITQDLETITFGRAVEVSSTGFFQRDAKSKSNDDVFLSINTIVEDCETGERLGSRVYNAKGPDLVPAMREVTNDSVSVAYKFQQQRRNPK